MLALCDPHDIQILQRGTRLTTIGFNGKHQYWKIRLSPCASRILLDEDGPERNLLDYIEVMDIGEVRYGCRTDVFHTALQALE